MDSLQLEDSSVSVGSDDARAGRIVGRERLERQGADTMLKMEEVF